MLDELSQLQDDTDEQYWMTSIEFSVETRSEDGNELIHKTYTFTWGEQFDEWYFSEYEEKRCVDTVRIGDRDWQEARHVWWHEIEEPVDVDVPQKVSDKLAERLGTDEITFNI